MNDHSVTDNELFDLMVGNLDSEKAAQVARHIETCLACQTAIMRWRTIHSLVRDDDSVSPPPRAVVRAQSIFSQRRSLPQRIQLSHGNWRSRTFAFAGGFVLAVCMFLGLGLAIANADIPPDSLLYPVQVTVKGLQIIASHFEKPRPIPSGYTPPSSPETIAVPLVLTPVPSSYIVISQIYGGGGNTGATYTHDFIELFNRGTITVSLAGWSLQYASATGTGNFGATAAQSTELPNITLAPGQYFLIQEGRGSDGTTPLPSPDFIDPTPIALSATDGKLVLVNTTVPLGCNGNSNPCPSDTMMRVGDLVGYGKADFFEGKSPAPAGSNTTAIIRVNDGCSVTESNMTDFVIGVPLPRNTSSPRIMCASTAPKP
jgi:hypothetical protein